MLGTITQITSLTYDVKSFHINIPGKPSYLPGQFLVLSVNAFGKVRKRAYSIASPPHWNNVELIIKILPNGRVTRVLDKMVVGDSLDLEMPFGFFSLPQNINDIPDKIVFLAGGVGLAPLLSMIRHLEWIHYKGDVTLIFGNRTPDDIIYLDELNRLKNDFGLNLVLLVDHPGGFDWSGEVGFITPDIIKKYSDVANSSFYICGPPQMVGHMIQNLSLLNVPKNRIHYEQW